MPRVVFRRAAEVQGRLRATLATHVDEPGLERLARTAKPLSFKHREQLWARGSSGRLAYILEGAFDIMHDDEVVDTLGPRHFLGLSSLWESPHRADALARETLKDRGSEALVWDTRHPETLDAFCSTGLLKKLLRDAQGLVHHLNDLQVLYRRKCGAVGHVALHIRRLALCREGGKEVEIGQRELGLLAGYDPRTVRVALGELIRAGCIVRLRRSTYEVGIEALTQRIELEKGGRHDLSDGSLDDDPRWNAAAPIGSGQGQVVSMDVSTPSCREA